MEDGKGERGDGRGETGERRRERGDGRRETGKGRGEKGGRKLSLVVLARAAESSVLHVATIHG